MKNFLKNIKQYKERWILSGVFIFLAVFAILLIVLSLKAPDNEKFSETIEALPLPSQENSTSENQIIMLEIGPVSEKITDESAILEWETNIPAETVLYYGNSEQRDNLKMKKFEINKLARQHSYKIENLESGTKYYYYIPARKIHENPMRKITSEFTTKSKNSEDGLTDKIEKEIGTDPGKVSSQLTYSDEEYGFEFKYPENWGTIDVEEISYDFINADEDSLRIEDRSKKSKIANIQKRLSFSNKNNYSIKITGYSDSKPYEVICYEGPCFLLNILDIKKDIEANSNINFGGVKGRFEDVFFKPGGTLVRTYDFILPSYKLQIKVYYKDAWKIENYYLLNSQNPEEELSLEDLVDLNNNDEGILLDNFVKELNLFIQTLKFTN